MARTIILWTISILITFAAAYYQRTTGPTYPVSGSVTLSGVVIPYRMERSHAGFSNHLVAIHTKGLPMTGVLVWKRYRTEDPWTKVEMQMRNDSLVAELPAQPAAGKLMYQVMVQSKTHAAAVPAETIVIRFRGDVPVWVLIPHVLAMFLALLLSTRTGLEFFNPKANFRKLALWTVSILFIGGAILGPIMQKYAFGAYWTGFPFGTDLTDNKTLIALIVWIAALIGIMRSSKPKAWALTAALVMMIVYSIPHSVFGSELDYSTGKSRNEGLGMLR